MGIYFRRKTCRLCESDKVVLGSQFVPTPPGDIFASYDKLGQKEEAFPLDIYLCPNCGLIQILDVVDPAVLYGTYIYRTQTSLGLPEYFRKYAEEVLAFVAPQAGGLVIDIGCNDGTLLRYYKEKGFKVLGVDPAPIAQQVNASGIEVLQRFFNTELGKEIRSKYGTPSLVTANNVVANIDDLKDFFTGVRELIGQEGCFVFETGYGLDLVDKKLLDVVHHEHLSYFTVGSLQKSLGLYGLELIHVQHTISKGGCIRFYIQGKNGKRKVESSVSQMIEMETRKGIEKIKSFEPFNAFIHEIRERLEKELSARRARGATVVGYGASVGTTTLEHLFGLSDKIAYVVDDNPDRFGLYTPGHHIPVHPSPLLYDRRPQLVVVFAWRYIKSILDRHQAFVAQGGKFLVFLPEWKVYQK